MTESLGGHGATHEAVMWIAAVIGFVASCVGLLVVYRRLSGRVELERAEAVLAADAAERAPPAKLKG